MLQPFLIALRESVQYAVVLSVPVSYLSGQKHPLRWFLGGVLSGLGLGFLAGYLPSIAGSLPANETWTSFRYLAEAAIFYSGMAAALARADIRQGIITGGFFCLGFVICLFDMRSLAFFLHDMGAMEGKQAATALAGLAGGAAGLPLLLLARRLLGKLELEKALGLPGLLITVGALTFILGGVGELEKGNILTGLQKGAVDFLANAKVSFQALILISDHPFLKAPLSGALDFIFGDRTAMTATVVFISAPPVFLLIRLFARPDPLVEEIEVGAQRRLSVAFFRKDLLRQTLPVLTTLLALIVMLHQVNISMNPLYDPVPIPIREPEGERALRIPLSGRTGDFSDGQVKKFLYYHGNKQVIFLAIKKQDDSMGVALDECEICRPAEWNKDARGYAQRGGNLVCKYCMTPISIPTVNSPGGCNPIPVPFRIEGNDVVIPLDDLLRIYTTTQQLEKKGTHF